MEDPRLKIDDLRYPDFLQKAMIAYIFRILHPFTDEEVAELTEFYRLLWRIREKPRKHLELIKILNMYKTKKIEEEKQTLRDKLKNLELL